MRVYGTPYREVMALPMKVFWQLSGTVDRLLASEQKALLELLTTSQTSAEAAQQLHEALHKASPEPIKLTTHALIAASSVRDEDGFDELRRMT
jgi:hypothetical protein